VTVAVDGVVVVDKPPGWTSHDVVARMRRIAGTRRVGHAGTLDPMATGVLVVGIGRATKLLGYLAATDKEYDATMRLGVATTTDDADGDEVTRANASHVTDDQLAEIVGRFIGDIDQVPSSVSAIKVDGVRAYKRARSGEDVRLASRRVHVAELRVLDRRGDDVDLHVACSTGTYVRALARDIGTALGVGGHLTALRRTRVGGFTVDEACTLDEIAGRLVVHPLADVAGRTFPRWPVDDEVARRLSMGQRLAPVGLPGGVVAAFAPDGSLVALVEERDDAVRPVTVLR
jgi:tRNA pseudouridine55 synthase